MPALGGWGNGNNPTLTIPRMEYAPLAKPHFPPAKMITIARQRKMIVEEASV
jgi:hypothetical protein